MAKFLKVTDDATNRCVLVNFDWVKTITDAPYYKSIIHFVSTGESNPADQMVVKESMKDLEWELIDSLDE